MYWCVINTRSTSERYGVHQLEAAVSQQDFLLVQRKKSGSCSTITNKEDKNIGIVIFGFFPFLLLPLPNSQICLWSLSSNSFFLRICSLFICMVCDSAFTYLSLFSYTPFLFSFYSFFPPQFLICLLVTLLVTLLPLYPSFLFSSPVSALCMISLCIN